jgi:hypothetical protein
MNVSDKLSKVGDSFTINMYDNGFMVEISGKDTDGEWKTAKVLCQDLDQVIAIVTEVSTMERDS